MINSYSKIKAVFSLLNSSDFFNNKLTKLTYQYQKSDALIKMEKDADTNLNKPSRLKKRKARKTKLEQV